MARLQDKVALITGGTSGIGEATARLFAVEGARVSFTGRRRELGEHIAAEIEASGGEALFVPGDVTDAAHCEQAVAATLAAFGRIDILFNNAGIVPHGTIEETDEETWDRAFAVNVKGVYWMTRLALPIMRRQGGGVIVNNASDWGIVGGPGHTAYSATKGAVVLMTKSVALDYARENVRVNAICPGDTFVERWRTDDRDAASSLEDELKAMGDALPLGRVGAVDEIARAVLFLASDDSSFMTGATLIVDGGNTAG